MNYISSLSTHYNKINTGAENFKFRIKFISRIFDPMIRGLKALVQSLSLNFVDKKLEGAKINFPGGYMAYLVDIISGIGEGGTIVESMVGWGHEETGSWA